MVSIRKDKTASVTHLVGPHGFYPQIQDISICYPFGGFTLFLTTNTRHQHLLPIWWVHIVSIHKYKTLAYVTYLVGLHCFYPQIQDISICYPFGGSTLFQSTNTRHQHLLPIWWVHMVSIHKYKTSTSVTHLVGPHGFNPQIQDLSICYPFCGSTWFQSPNTKQHLLPILWVHMVSIPKYKTASVTHLVGPHGFNPQIQDINICYPFGGSTWFQSTNTRHQHLFQNPSLYKLKVTNKCPNFLKFSSSEVKQNN
ncbi:hypothetical protein Bpfe_023800 [Biomphalaria pfeifferi]|uniref:Uncharacterized protein n=1 Tax=Biomphalaria pfeifferi TaxID=112525 RepID=A0AAD8F1C9_BIOPF|nr:hypothetical protein Bpfe_023800 [Biomphalaria pfeifferi]